MQNWMEGALRKSSLLFGPPLALLVMLFGSSPALGAEEGYKGWFAALDVALAQPNSLDQHFANVFDTSVAGAAPGTRLLMDNDSDTTFRVDFGYGFGKGLGSLHASYWSFDNDDEMTGSATGAFYPSIFGDGYNYGTQDLDSPTFTSTSSVKATVADLDYVRSMSAGDKFEVKWLLGLRVATYEEDQAFTGSDASYTYAQAKSIESDAIGLRVGATATFGFSEHFNLEAGMALSFLQADTEGTSTQGCTAGLGCPFAEAVTASDDNIRGAIRDYDVRAVWSFKHLDYFLGYAVSEWDGLVADPLPPGANGEGPHERRGRETIAFNSVHAGVVWRFGTGR